LSSFGILVLKLWEENASFSICALKLDVLCSSSQELKLKTWVFLCLPNLYVVEYWRRIPILLNLQLQVIDGATFNNLTCIIVQSLLDFGGMNKTKVAKKLVCFGVYGMATFQGVKFGVTTKLMQKHIPFVSDVNNICNYVYTFKLVRTYLCAMYYENSMT